MSEQDRREYQALVDALREQTAKVNEWKAANTRQAGTQAYNDYVQNVTNWERGIREKIAVLAAKIGLNAPAAGPAGPESILGDLLGRVDEIQFIMAVMRLANQDKTFLHSMLSAYKRLDGGGAMSYGSPAPVALHYAIPQPGASGLAFAPPSVPASFLPAPSAPPAKPPTYTGGENVEICGNDAVITQWIWDQQHLQDTLDISAWVMIAAGIVTCTALQLGITAGYGRYAVESSLSIPGRWAWFLQEAPSFFISAYFLFSCQTTTSRFILALFVGHYFVRTFLFPLWLKSSKPTPFYIFMSAFCFCAWNGFMQGAYHARVIDYEANHLFKPVSLAGVALFFVGFAINQHSDHILRNLRQPGETAYKIPRGGLSTTSQAQTILVKSSNAANIGPRALQHHRWYLQKFDNYPKERAAIIPFLL
ncbi:unnamed protein product, partial [Mesorhabditis spiculigera]